MSGRSKTSAVTTSEVTPNAISSPALESGPTHFAELDGQTILPFGQGAVRVSRSPQAGYGKASTINVISGPHGIGSSASIALTNSLANRLRRALALRGSTLFRLTWKTRVTPSGRRIPALRASARRTSRQRLYFVAKSDGLRWRGRQATAGREARADATRSSARLGHMGIAERSRLEGHAGNEEGPAPQERNGAGSDRSVAAASLPRGFWSDVQWVSCRDGKRRPVEPRTFPLVTSAPAGVVRLRGYGNALCAEQAIAFIQAYREVA